MIDGFRDGIIPGLKDKSTMRHFLATQLGCLTKRISKKYEKTGYNGRLPYKAGSGNLEPEEVKKREALWAELQAHGRAAQHISALVDRARELVEAQGQTSMQDENEYMDQQGFGTFPEETADHTFN